jgi:hypothetical protein
MMSDPKVLGYAVAFVYSIVVAFLWIPALVIRRIGRLVREIGSESWPRADGSIADGTVQVIRGWIVDYAIGQLDYSYRVHGEYYAGNINRQFTDEQAAWEFVDSCRQKPVVVRYRDDSPQKSVLLEADQDPGWTLQPTAGPLQDIRQHWSDELRRDPMTDPDDENVEDKVEELENGNNPELRSR